MSTATARLDHVIAEVADIRSAHAELFAHGYPEAWPIGPFWPNALTSGVNVGSFNLELYQPLDREPANPAIRTLVFEPTSIAAVAAAMDELGLACELREKIEPDPELLRLRGFTGDRPERICTNLVPLDPPFPFFFCDYAPFLRERLGPHAFRVERPVQKIVYGLPPEAMRIVERLGFALQPVEFVESGSTGVLAITPELPITR